MISAVRHVLPGNFGYVQHIRVVAFQLQIAFHPTDDH